MCKYMSWQAVVIRGAQLSERRREAISDHGGMSVKKLLSANLPAIGLPALLLLGGALVGQSALAHHSFTMFDYGSDIELDGTVVEFKFINPHAFIILKVKGKDGRLETWALEGQPTPILEQEGWTRQTSSPGIRSGRRSRHCAAARPAALGCRKRSPSGTARRSRPAIERRPEPSLERARSP